MDKTTKSKEIKIGYNSWIDKNRYKDNIATVSCPNKKHKYSHCWDVYSNGILVISPGDTVKVKTNLRLNIPTGYACILHERSGFVNDKDCVVDAGIIDSDYTGEIIIFISRKPKISWIDAYKHCINEDINDGKRCDNNIKSKFRRFKDIISRMIKYHKRRNSDITIEPYSRVAQMEICKTIPVKWEICKNFKKTSRNSKGMGSTGIK